MKRPSGPREWIALGSEKEIEEECVRETRKKVERLTKSTHHTCMLQAWFFPSPFFSFILYLSLSQPLCLFVVICLTVFLWSATVHILQGAQEIWPADLLFRPQRCRCSGWPHRLCFLQRQQFQH